MAKYTTWKIDEEVDLRMGTEGPEAMAPVTVIDTFKATVARLGAAPALHQKVNGEWKTTSFQEYYAQCEQFGKALLHVGVPRFGGVSILGFNSPEWLVTELGTIMAGGVAAGIYTTNSPQACQFIAKHSDSEIVVCDGVKQLEKFVAIEKNLPKLKALVVYNDPVPEGLQTGVPVYTFADFLKLGADVAQEKLDERIAAQKPGHCCSLIYTSGTTGDPKAVMISHDNFTWTIATVVEMVKTQFEVDINNRDRIVSYLPLSHVAGQLIDVILPVSVGLQLFFAQPDALKGSLGNTLKDVRPTLFFGVPRVWEKIAEKMWEISAQTTGLKKRIAGWARSKGAIKTELAQYGQSGGAPCGFGVAHALVLGRIKEALGLDQCVAAFSGAAPISREVVEYFGSLDMPLFEFFGQSEATGPQTCSMRGMWRIGTCGRTIAGSHTAVVPETQELIFSGRNIMMGYLKGEQVTKDTIDAEGWIHSGDCGKIDENGFMTITGRIKELLITAGGENVPPIPIEDALKEEIQLLSNAVLLGDKRKFLAAMFTLRVTADSEGMPTDKLDAKALSIMKEIGSSATTVAEAKADDKVKKYLEDGVKRANARATSRAQNVAKFEVLDKDFSIGGGELTPTLKLKRKIVMEKYADVVEKIYK